MRPRRFLTDALMSFCMTVIYPYRVWVARANGEASMAVEQAPAGGCCGGHKHAGHDHSAVAKVRDPVCGMSVDPETSKHRFDFHGETWHFCSAACRTRFAADP